MTALRKNIMLGTAGHVDHGKTALVKILTGCDTDTLAAEKQRGLTIELGFAPCTMADERIVGVVDVPGHVSFIRNMVAGAHGVDVVILVVAADDSVMPQTREHLDILTLMGVRHGLVAMTKIDLVDAEMRELVADDVRGFVAGTFLADAPICPISNITGEGFDGFFTALNAAVAHCEPRQSTGMFRLWIERSFGIRGFGTVVSGIPTAGEVRVGDRLELVPGGRIGRVRGLEVYGQKADVGRAGECTAINVDDIDAEHLTRGRLLCERGAAAAVSMVEADLQLLGHMTKELKDYAEAHLHVGTGEAMAKVALLEGKRLAPGERQLVQLRLSEPLGIAPGDRFVLRANVPGAGGGGLGTIGGGRILDTSDQRLRRGRPWTLAALSARREAIDSPAAWCGVILRESRRTLAHTELAAAAKVPCEQLVPLLDELHRDGVIVAAGKSRGVHRDVVETAAAQAIDALRRFHEANPKRLGMEPTDLAAAAQIDRAVYDVAEAQLIEDGRIERHGTMLVEAGRVLKLSDEDQALCDRIETTLREAKLTPPLPGDLAATLGVPAERLDAMVRLLADHDKVVKLDPKVIMHRQTLDEAQEVVLGLFRKANSFTTMEFRDALGVSRKYAVPVLDYFDSIRLTARGGNRRTAGKTAKDLL